MPATNTSEPPTGGNGHATSGILSTISRGKRPRHIFALIYGTDGVGKSTLCSHAPIRSLSMPRKGPSNSMSQGFRRLRRSASSLASSGHYKLRNTNPIRSYSIVSIGSSP